MFPAELTDLEFKYKSALADYEFIAGTNSDLTFRKKQPSQRQLELEEEAWKLVQVARQALLDAYGLTQPQPRLLGRADAAIPRFELLLGLKGERDAGAQNE